MQKNCKPVQKFKDKKDIIFLTQISRHFYRDNLKSHFQRKITTKTYDITYLYAENNLLQKAIWQVGPKFRFTKINTMFEAKRR